jgi:mono/diheme cytochrome c family protein
MRDAFLLFTVASVLCGLGPTPTMQAQSDAAKIYKTNCALCHGADGSGEGTTGKALHAKDLRSDEVLKKSDETLSEIISKGKGKMPAFGAKIKPDDVTKMVAYIRALPKQK